MTRVLINHTNSMRVGR